MDCDEGYNAQPNGAHGANSAYPCEEEEYDVFGHMEDTALTLRQTRRGKPHEGDGGTSITVKASF